MACAALTTFRRVAVALFTVAPGLVGLAQAAPLSEALAPIVPTATVARALPAERARNLVSTDVHRLLAWIRDTRDNAGLGFVVVDKRGALLHVFDEGAGLLASSAVLLGSARGDDTVPGIGSRALADVKPEERTTPAGRFLGETGLNIAGRDVVWVDYDAAVSMHRVITSNPAENRLQRLASPSAADNRISYGCINVPVDFFDAVIRPTFAAQHALIYVLPEHKSLQSVFGIAPSTASVRAAKSRVTADAASPIRASTPRR